MQSGNFSQIIPLMLTMHYALGAEVWHNDHNYANLTIDGPALVEPYYQLRLYGAASRNAGT